MADLLAHVEQARHNETCANLILATDVNARDWAITAAFYSAVHLVEAGFTTMHNIGHSEMAADRGKRGLHKYREDKMLGVSRPAYDSYRKLSNASYNVRYLPSTAPGGSLFALLYYKEPEVRKMLEVYLPTVRSELERALGVRLS